MRVSSNFDNFTSRNSFHIILNGDVYVHLRSRVGVALMRGNKLQVTVTSGNMKAFELRVVKIGVISDERFFKKKHDALFVRPPRFKE